MAIIIHLDILLAKRKMRSKRLAELMGITEQNLSILKTGRAKAIRLSTLEALCRILQCQPGELLTYVEDAEVTEVTPALIPLEIEC
jgi:putative transcriptional regulator